MAGRDGTLRVQIRGLHEVLRALDKLPTQARDEMRKTTIRLSQTLASKIRAAGRASSKQSARAAATVRPSRGLTPGVIAGPHPFLFLSEFGMNRRTGWYGKPRYGHSHQRQARPHLGGKSYWFFRTADESSGEVNDAARQAGEHILQMWSA